LSGLSRALPEGAPGKRYLHAAGLPRIERYLAGMTHFSDEAVAGLLDGDMAATLARRNGARPFAAAVAGGGGLAFPGRLQHLDLETYLPGDILTKVDRMSMAHSIEARVPLLDHTLVEFAASLPAALTLRGGRGKYIFKKALTGIVPDEILTRSKKGFSVPLAYWFREGLGDYLGDHLL